MRFPLRRALATLFLFCGLVIGGKAWSATADCSVKGAFSVALSPCPLDKTLRFDTSSNISIHVSASGTFPSRTYIALGAPSSIVQPNSFAVGGASIDNFYIYFATYSKLAAGEHTGSMDIRLCADSACKSVLAEVALPYDFDVVVPPLVSSLSPSSVLLGTGAFTLRVVGSRFTRDCKVHVGSTAFATTYVSSRELTIRLNLSAVATARRYNVTVIPSTGIASNVAHFTVDNPMPTVMALSPVSTMAVSGANPPTITVTGTGFQPTSRVNVNGVAVSTQYISATELAASPPAYPTMNMGVGADYDISVSTPGPGGGTSGTLTFTVLNNAPALTALSPSMLPTVAFGARTFFIQGTGLQSNSVVQINGVTYPFDLVFVDGQYELDGALPVDSYSVGAIVPVTVTNPAPGGGTSNTLTLTVDNPAPSLQWISPVQAHAGSGDMTLTLRTLGYNAGSAVEWNGTPLQGVTSVTTTLSGTTTQFLRVTVPAADLATAGTATVALVNPAPGGGTAQTAFTVIQPPPEIDALSPGFIGTGGGDFTLTLSGQDFDPSATVFWNADQLVISSISATQIQVTVPAAEVSGAGVAKLTVVNPVATGGASLPASFAVDDSGTAVVPLAQQVNDLVWDPTRAVFYGSIPFDDAAHPKSIATVDPALAGIIATTPEITSTSNPNLLSMSSDGVLIYVNGSSSGDPVLRYTLPAFTLDQKFLLGGLVTTLQVSPRFSRVFAVNQVFGGATPSQPELFMDALELVNTHGWEPWDAAAWAADGSHLYAGDNTDAGNDLVSMDFDLLGNTIATPTSTPGVWMGTDMHLDQASGLIYADKSTKVIDPTVPKFTSAVYPVSGVMVPDSTLGCAYFITQTAAQVTAGNNDYTLSCYSTTDQTLTRSLVIPSIVGAPTKMLRWGNEGLAFITDAGYIYFVSGQVVTGN